MPLFHHTIRLLLAHKLAKYATFLRYCVVGVMASGVFYGVANLSALLLKVDSRSEAQSLESTFENAQNVGKLAQDSNAFTQNAQILETPQAANRQLQNASKSAQDFNASTQNAQNVGKSATQNAQNVSESAQDSNAFTQNAQNASKSAQDFNASTQNAQNASESAQDSRILELQIGVFQGSQGDKTSGLSTLRADEIHDFSPKAESTKEAQYSQMATLLGSLASFLFGYFAQMRLAFRAYPSHSTMLPRYLALLALIAIYAQAIAYLGAFFTLSYYLVSAFIALSVPLFSYPLQKLWVFAETSKGGGRLSKDSAFGLESWISSPRFVDRPQVLSSLRGLKSHDSISKILESLFLLSLRALRSKAWQSISAQADSKKNAYKAEILESNFTQSHDSISKILESLFLLSLRDTAPAVAWQSISAQADSKKNAYKAEILESNFTQSHDSISKILESTFSYNAPTLNKPAKDSRICDEKSWLSRQWQGSYLSGSDRRHCRRIHDLSRKAESTRKWLFGLTPRPSIRPLLLAHSSNNPNIHTPFTTTETMDCRATASALARNDRNNAAFQSIASLEKVDSRSKAQPTHHDSKHCSGAVVALRDFGGRARLEVCGCPKNRAINRIAYPRLNRSRILQKHLIPFLRSMYDCLYPSYSLLCPTQCHRPAATQARYERAWRANSKP